MSMMLRIIKHSRKFNGANWNVLLNHSQCTTKSLSYKGYDNYLKPQSLVKSYATKTAVLPESPNFFEVYRDIDFKLQRNGRIVRSDIEKMLNELNQLPQISTLHALGLIKACGRQFFETTNAESIELIKQIWTTLIKLKAPLDVSHYNALLSVYLDKEHKFSPDNFLEMMAERKIEPNRITYQRLIAVYCREGDIAGATKLLGIMKNKGIPLCENIFNSLVFAYAVKKDFESANGIITTMQNAQVPPTASTYEALVNAYANHGDMDGIRTTLEKVKSLSMAMSNSQMLNTCYNIAAAGHTAIAEEFIDTYIMKSIFDIEVAPVLIKLANIGQLKLAEKLLEKTSNDHDRQRIRAIFILKAAIKNQDIPSEELCELFKNYGNRDYISNAFQQVLPIGLTTHANPKTLIPLYKLWKEKGGDIRMHYFWPFLTKKSLNTHSTNVTEIIETMMNDFNLTPCATTLQRFILPNMESPWEERINTLQSLGIPRDQILNAAVLSLIMEKKIRDLCVFMHTVPNNYRSDLFLRILIRVSAQSNFPKKFVVAIRLMDKDPEKQENSTPKELVDKAIRIYMQEIENGSNNLISLLEEFKAAGLSISPEVSEEVKEYLGENSMRLEVDTLLQDLSSGTLSEVPMEIYNPFINISTMSISTQKNNYTIKNKLNNALLEKNSEEVLEALKELEGNSIIPPGMLAQSISLFSEVGNLEAAEHYVTELKSMKEFKLDANKVLQYMLLLVRNDRIEDAIAFLSEQPEATLIERSISILQTKIAVLLEEILKKGNHNLIDNLISIFQSKNYIKNMNHVLRPLVTVPLEEGNIEKALEEFEKICIKHKVTPGRFELTKAFLDREDADTLQKIIDLTSEIYGEANALFDFAFNLIIWDRAHHACKIFETSQFPIHNAKIKMFIDRCEKFDDYDSLDRFVKILKAVVKVDRNYLFNSLLDIYEKKNDWQRGLGLWIEMQESDTIPNSTFLNKLSLLLKTNNQEIPFNADNSISKTADSEKLPITPSARMKYNNVPNKFYLALEREDYASAENIILESFVNLSQKYYMYNLLIKQLLIKNDDIDKAYEFSKSMIRNYSTIGKVNFERISANLIKAGRFEDFNYLGSLLNNKTKIEVKFDRYLSWAKIREQGLEKYIDNVHFVENPSSFQNSIHFACMVDELVNQPDLVPKFAKWTEKVEQTYGIDRAKQVLWNYYFIKGLPEADELWNELISKLHSPMILPIIRFAKLTKNIEMLKKLEKQIQNSCELVPNIHGKLATGFVELYNDLDRYEDALDVVEKFKMQYPVKMLALKCLQDLEAGLKRKGIPIPFKLIIDDHSRF